MPSVSSLHVLLNLFLLTALSTGCAKVVIDSSRHPGFQQVLEPVAFVIYERNTGPDYTEPLRAALLEQLAMHGIRGTAHIITGGEFDADASMKSIAESASGVILIVPTGGTSYYGALQQIRYEVDAFQMSSSEDGSKVWHARVDTGSGGYGVQNRNRLALFAQRLVDRLITDRILPGRSTPAPGQEKQPATLTRQ